MLVVLVFFSLLSVAAAFGAVLNLAFESPFSICFLNLTTSILSCGGDDDDLFFPPSFLTSKFILPLATMHNSLLPISLHFLLHFFSIKSFSSFNDDDKGKELLSPSSNESPKITPDCFLLPNFNSIATTDSTLDNFDSEYPIWRKFKSFLYALFCLYNLSYCSWIAHSLVRSCMSCPSISLIFE